MANASRGRKPVEWVLGRVNTIDGTVENYRLSLGLKDDEVAEIHKVDMQIDTANVPDAANDTLILDQMLSMDPDVIADPAVAANHDDLEIFAEQNYTFQQEIGAAGQTTLILSDNKISDFKMPVLVGTDVGMVVHGDADIACQFKARLYFTRRKANVMELNQVLLKRR